MSAPSLQLVIARKADADESAIYKYISETFGNMYANNFRKRLIELLTMISKQPFVGRPAKGNASIRVLVMSKQNRIIYKNTETQVIVLRILNTGTKLAGDF